MSGDGEGVDAEAYNPGIIVRAKLSEESNGVNLHPIQVEYTYEFLGDLVAGSKDAENTKEAMPTGTVEWMSTLKKSSNNTVLHVRRTIPITGAHRQSSIHGLGARCKVPCCMAIAEKRRGHVSPTTGLRGAGVRPMKVLR